jgi:energy-coupling factor transporter ATP-binding protein EcfA2
MTELHQIVRVDFTRFKAFRQFTLSLKRFNVLVGPNNAGKSTILAAFRILAAGIRRASARKPSWVQGPRGGTFGYVVDMRPISVADENIIFDSGDNESASVVFTLSNKNKLTLFFPSDGVCHLIADCSGRMIQNPTTFRAQFNCPIGFVPILGPVDHQESLFEREAARNALYNYRAARNFRNIWYHFPDSFAEFRDKLQQTWPGMDVQPPEVSYFDSKPRLHMYCPEHRIPREIFWAGFGFQVWCQMLTHLIQSKDKSLFLIDEPDIYLHSDLQRQLLNLLRDLGPDIIIATHSTEIITEAETDDIVLVSKANRSGRRIRSADQLHEVLRSLGSNVNPILTQLAKTRRVLFVEGQDFQILGKFARKLGAMSVGNQRDFAVVPVDGFNPERIRNLKAGMEATLGTKIFAAAILDKDYRSEDECGSITAECKKFCDMVSIHTCKEIENFLLVPPAIDRAISQRVAEQSRRLGIAKLYDMNASDLLGRFADEQRNDVASQYIFAQKQFARAKGKGLHETEITKNVLDIIGRQWADPAKKIEVVGGKEALSFINKNAQAVCGVSITATSIIDAMRIDEVPEGMRRLVEMLKTFSVSSAE